VAKLQRRIEDLESLTRDNVDCSDDRVDNVEHSIRDTIREVFGEGSTQFDRHRHFRINDGPVRMVGMFEDPHAAHASRQREFVADLPGAVTRVRGLIAALAEKREELTEPAIAPRIAFEGRSLNSSIAAAASRLYKDGHYAQAVLEASKALVGLVKMASGRQDLDGANLMRTVFSRKNAVLAFNQLLDQSDDDEQEGMMHLFEGAVMAIRNPAAHRVGAYERPDRALQHLELLSLLADRLSEVRKLS
jgi:uncharacterized protein (TIGR02391 family)